MNKNELHRMFERDLSIEEVPNFENLVEIEELIKNSNLDPKRKRALLQRLKKLSQESKKHSILFETLIRQTKK